MLADPNPTKMGYQANRLAQPCRRCQVLHWKQSWTGIMALIRCPGSHFLRTVSEVVRALWKGLQNRHVATYPASKARLYCSNVNWSGGLHGRLTCLSAILSVSMGALLRFPDTPWHLASELELGSNDRACAFLLVTNIFHLGSDH